MMPVEVPTDSPPDAARRIIDLDVTRAVALIGVCVMNYHGYLILRGGQVGEGAVAHFFDPWNGPLSTRFAAAFVMIAGMGVTLLARRAHGDRRAEATIRWVLIRRGVLLYAAGYLFNWVWEGTILFYYGAMFVIAGLIFSLRTAWLAAIGGVAAIAAAAINRWGRGHDADWLYSPAARSPRGLLFDTFVNGTHPLLPWLAFFCLGMILARHMPWTSTTRVMLAFAGVLAVAATYGLRAAAPANAELSTEPWSRSVVYTVCASGSAVVAICLIGSIAAASRGSLVTRALAAAGRCTLTLYIAHALVFNLVVHRLGWIRPTGLDTALLFALGFWVIGIIAAAWWVGHFGLGPLERLYRAFGGAHR